MIWAKYITALCLSSVFILVSAQTKIKLIRHIHYLPSLSTVGNQSWKIRGHVLTIDHADVNEIFPDTNGGRVKVSSQDDTIVYGNYSYVYTSNGRIIEMIASFPALKSIKKIEFVDDTEYVFFTDMFEDNSIFIVEVINQSSNSFVFNGTGNVHLSIDGSKTWVPINAVGYDTNTFVLDDTILKNPKMLIVIDAYDPMPPHLPGLALLCPNPDNYVFEFADGDILGTQVSSYVPGHHNKPPGKPNKRGKKR